MKVILLLISLTISVNCYAANFEVGLGAFALGTSAQNDTSGGQATTSFNPGVSVGAIIPIKGNHYFNPDFGVVGHLPEDDDYGKQRKRTSFALWDLGYRIKRVVIRYGFGTFMTRISGDGEAVTVRNGESGTATAYQPVDSSTSYNTTINLGATILLGDRVSVRAESYLFSFLNSEARTLNYGLTLHVLL